MTLRADILDFDIEGVQRIVESVDNYLVSDVVELPCPDHSTDRKPPQPN
jgi:hypothetical protein